MIRSWWHRGEMKLNLTNRPALLVLGRSRVLRHIRTSPLKGCLRLRRDVSGSFWPTAIRKTRGVARLVLGVTIWERVHQIKFCHTCWQVKLLSVPDKLKCLRAAESALNRTYLSALRDTCTLIQKTTLFNYLLFFHPRPNWALSWGPTYPACIASHMTCCRVDYSPDVNAYTVSWLISANLPRWP